MGPKAFRENNQIGWVRLISSLGLHSKEIIWVEDQEISINADLSKGNESDKLLSGCKGIS